MKLITRSALTHSPDSKQKKAATNIVAAFFVRVPGMGDNQVGVSVKKA